MFRNFINRNFSIIFISYLTLKKTKDALAPILLFFISNSLTFHVTQVGYLDNIMMAYLVILSLVKVNSSRGVAAVFLITVIGTLTHEMFIFLAAPVMIIKTALVWTDKKTAKKQKRLVALTYGTAVITMVIHSCIVVGTDWLLLSTEGRLALNEKVKSIIDFQMHRNNFRVLTRPFVDNLLLNHIYYEDLFGVLYILSSNLTFLPLTALYIFLIYKSFKNIPITAHIGIAALGVLPLWLIFVAWIMKGFLP